MNNTTHADIIADLVTMRDECLEGMHVNERVRGSDPRGDAGAAFIVCAKRLTEIIERHHIAGANKKVEDPQYSDAAMVERAVRNARPHRCSEAPRWVSVRDVFGYGSTTSVELCQRFGLDPYEKVDGIKCDCEDQ